MRRSLKLTAAALAAVLLAACGSGGHESDGDAAAVLTSDVEPTATTRDQVEGFDTLIDSCTAMGLTALQVTPEDNVVYSPLSWCMALGMLAGGSTNDARAEIEAAFGVSVEQAQEALNALAGELAAFETDPGSIDDDDLPETPAVHRATNVVVRHGFEVEQDYLDSLARWFDSGMMTADFAHPDSKEVLSEWVNHHTGGRIEESAIEPNPDLVMVLQDALLFAAAWQSEFQPSASTLEFTNLDGEVVDVDRIGETRMLDYVEVGGWKAARLPLTSDFTATFILSPEVGDALTPDQRDTLLASMEPQMVVFSFPRFELEGQLDLLDLLPELGITALLDADTQPLEGIAPDAGLSVTQAVQQAMIKVGEAGVVGAAVTEIAIEESSMPMPDTELQIDRPFHFLVTHTDTDTDLFQVAVRHLGDD